MSFRGDPSKKMSPEGEETRSRAFTFSEEKKVVETETYTEISSFQQEEDLLELNNNMMTQDGGNS